jgi:hypothetical protein
MQHVCFVVSFKFICFFFVTESPASPAGVVEFSYPAGGLGVHFPWKAPRFSAGDP